MHGAVTYVIAAALLLRLVGVGRDFLPGSGVLALLLATLHVTGILRRQSRLSDWHDIVRAHAYELALLAICALALGMRLPGFAGDLGHMPLDIDEHRFASTVKHYFVTGELLHETVEHYPGAVFWLFSGASFLAFLRGLTSGETTAASALPVETYVQAARLANIWVAVTTVAATGLIGRRLCGPAVGLLSAMLVAVVPLSVDVTVQARSDPGMVLAVVCATLAALVYYDEGKRRWIVGAAALAGIAGAIKYSAVFALVPVMIALFTRTPAGQRSRTFLATCAAFLVAVAVTNHFMWADVPNFLRQLSDQVAITGRGHWNATDNPAGYYLGTLVGLGPGWPIVILAGGFTVYALAERDPKLWILISFPVLYLWFMTQRPSQFPRWVYPLLPYIALAASAGLAMVIRFVGARFESRADTSRRWAEAAAAVICLIALWQPLWTGAISLSRRLQPPTHQLAESWIRQSAPAGSHVLLGRGWLDVDGAPFVARRVPDLRTTLDGGVEQLAGCQWVVVPEPLFGHPTLKQLSLAERFHARYSFGGNLGMDYEVYSVPDLPVAGGCVGGRAR
jgi:hypothetical protein